VPAYFVTKLKKEKTVSLSADIFTLKSKGLNLVEMVSNTSY
jgi:hypothetical protein